jgi:hypothetical protein
VSLFYCESCKNTIYDIKAASCVRLAEVWIAGAAKTYIAIENEKYRYFHKACYEIAKRKEGGWQEESLF